MKGLDYTALTVALWLGHTGQLTQEQLLGIGPDKVDVPLLERRLDLVALIFGNMTWLSRIIYAVVGICGLYLISVYGRISDHVLGQA